MMLEGANKFSEAVDFIIYTMNSVQTGQYCVVLPKNTNDVFHMLIDLRMKKLVDAVSVGNKKKEELVEKISQEYLNLKKKYTNGILVLPMIEVEGLDNATLNGDKQRMFDETKRISAITSELYKKLMDLGVEKQKIDQKIIIVEKDEKDEKFVAWLKEQMPNFVDGVLYRDLEDKPVVENPFMVMNPFASNESVVTPEKPVSSGGIFDQIPSPVTSSTSVPASQPVTPAPVVEPVSSSPENTSFELFASEPTAPVVENKVVENSKPESVFSSVTPEVEAPKPVQNVGLDGTITFSPIPESQPQSPVQPQPVSGVSQSVPSNAYENSDDGEERKSSKGFANLLILLVILVGVTIASIELGKFLYSVYGA